MGEEGDGFTAAPDDGDDGDHSHADIDDGKGHKTREPALARFQPQIGRKDQIAGAEKDREYCKTEYEGLNQRLLVLHVFSPG